MQTPMAQAGRWAWGEAQSRHWEDPHHAHGDLTSLAPHERLPEILVVWRFHKCEDQRKLLKRVNLYRSLCEMNLHFGSEGPWVCPGLLCP